jgi:hypothetical protein
MTRRRGEEKALSLSEVRVSSYPESGRTALNGRVAQEASMVPMHIPRRWS